VLILSLAEDKKDLGACSDTRERRAKVCFQQEKVFGVEERVENMEKNNFSLFSQFFSIFLYREKV